MYIHAIVSPRDVRVEKGSMQSSSRCVNCHSASSFSSNFFFTTPSGLMSSIIAYVAGGGIKASLAAIRAGHGGQQKIPHSRLTAFQVILLLPPLIFCRNVDCLLQENGKQQYWTRTIVSTVSGNFTDAFSAFIEWPIRHEPNSSINKSNATKN